MPEPFKTWFNPALIARIGEHLARHDAAFDRDGFVAMACDGLETLELKARSARITAALIAHLPADFGAACALMLATLHPEESGTGESDSAGLRGWAVMPMADLVSARGRQDLDRSMAVLQAMTTRCSAEFAVRPFLLADQDRALRWHMDWTAHANDQVRRLASEGARPRLPWGIRLRPLVEDPAPLLPILTALRDDPSETVRRSVANNLNDIAKDHPDLVAAIARDWLRDAPPERQRLVRHACRTLVKRGHPGALSALGFDGTDVAARLDLAKPVVRYGDGLAFSLALTSTARSAQRLSVDYALHFRKASGATAPKVFKLRVLDLAPGATASIDRRHPIRPITTRRYYDGVQRLEILVNGATVAGAEFSLTGAPG